MAEELTGGYWRTTKDDHHVYIKGGSIEAGLGKEAGKGPLAGHKINDDGSITTPRGVTIHPKAGLKSAEGPSTASKEVEANFHKRRDAILPIIAKHHGVTPEEVKSNLQKAAENAVKGAEVWIRAPHTAVPKIVAAGRFKTQVETGKSGGSYAPQKRIDFENRFFGTPKDAKPEERPIYGHLEKGANGYSEGKGSDSVGMYGNVAFKLKPSVKDRTTFTGEDSLAANALFLHSEAQDGVGNARILPSLVTKPSGVSLKHANDGLTDEEEAQGAINDAKGGKYLSRASLSGAATGKDLNDISGMYAEAQVHGGVKLSDVAEAVFYDKNHFQAYSADLAKAGVPSRYVANPHMKPEHTANPHREDDSDDDW